MADKFKDFSGLKNGAKSPSSIENEQNHAKSGSKKVMQVVGGSLDAIVASNAETPVKPNQVIRFFNDNAATQFVWVGEAGSAPGTVDATNGFAIGSKQELIIACAEPLSGKSAAFKSSSTTVQAALIE